MTDLSSAASFRLPTLSASGAGLTLLVLFAVFALASPHFATVSNLTNILVQSTILLLLAIPMTFIVMTEGLDLSMGAVATLASVTLALTLVATQSITLGLLATLAVGGLFGLANGLAVAMAGLPPFVATLGTMGIAQGFALIASEGNIIVNLPAAVQSLYSGRLLGIPAPLWIGAAAYLLFHGLLHHTRLGTYVPALGGNREALRLAGMKERQALTLVYLLGGLMAGLAALLLTARVNAGHPTAGIGLEFDAVAAVAVGGTQFEHGKGWLFGTLIGVLTIGVLRNGLNLIEVPSSLQVVCVGVLVVLALFIDGLRSAK